MTMIARITRTLLLIQAIFAAVICMLAIKLWHVDNFVLGAIYGLSIVLAVRAVITISNFCMAWHFRSPVPEGFRLNWPQTCRLIAQEFRATMWSSSWTMPFQAFDKHVAMLPAGLPVLLVHGYGC